jgi:hypothetical protein
MPLKQRAHARHVDEVNAEAANGGLRGGWRTGIRVHGA